MPALHTSQAMRTAAAECQRGAVVIQCSSGRAATTSNRIGRPDHTPLLRPTSPSSRVCTLSIRHQPRKRASLAVTAASAAGAAPAEGGGGSFAAFIDAFWKFLRPHTIRGTILGASAVTARALIENQQFIDWGLLPRALLGVAALLCGNGYIVGINQIYDVEIDAVNKPFLPVAAGELSPRLAWLLCAGLAAGGLALTAANFGTLITSLYAFGLALGTVYSVPPLRLKRFAVPAFLIIATVRGFLLNFGVYYATRAALGAGKFVWSPAISFITCFVTLFACVIAITKDMPDVEGDKAYNISTFATRLGVRNIAFLGSGLLLVNYVGAVVLALALRESFRTPLMAGAHALLGAALVWQTGRLDASGYSKEGIAAYYRFIWNLFYAEYAMFPFL